MEQTGDAQLFDAELPKNHAELQAHVYAEASRLQALIRAASAEAEPLNAEGFKIIGALGSAAHHLMLAYETLRDGEQPVSWLAPTEPVEVPAPTIDVDEPEQPLLLEPPIDIPTEATDEPEPIPQPAQPTELPEPEPEVEPTIEPEPETEPIPAAPEKLVAPLAPVEASGLGKLRGLNMTAEELKTCEKIFELIGAADDTVTLRDISMQLFDKARLDRTTETRLRQLLNGYALAGTIVAAGKTYRLPSEAEKALQSAEAAASAFEYDDDLEEADLKPLQLMATLTAKEANGKINVGQFVRTFFEQPRVDRSLFNDVVAHLNYYCERGFLTYHGDGWYGMGDREIPSMLLVATREPELIESPAPVAAPTPEETPGADTSTQPAKKQPAKARKASKPITNRVETATPTDLTQREQLMLDLMLQKVTPGTWFQQGLLDLDALGFSSESARRQAFSKLTEKLIEQGILEGEGARGGRKYRLTQKTAQPIAAPQKAVAAPFVSVDQTPTITLTYSEIQQQKRDKAIAFAAGLVTALEAQLSEAEQPISSREIAKFIADSLQLTTSQGHNLLDALVTKGHFHYEGVQRERKVVSGPNPIQEAAETPAEQVEIPNELELTYVKHIFSALLGLKHVQQGVQPRKLIQELALTGEQEQVFRRVIRTMEAQGYIVYDAKANPNTRSDHSKKLYLPMLKLPDQHFKKHLRTDYNGVMKDIRRGKSNQN